MSFLRKPRLRRRKPSDELGIDMCRITVLYALEKVDIVQHQGMKLRMQRLKQHWSDREVRQRFLKLRYWLDASSTTLSHSRLTVLSGQAQGYWESCGVLDNFRINLILASYHPRSEVLIEVHTELKTSTSR